MIQAALFDMDGTVLDTLDDLCDSVNHCLHVFGLPERTRDELRMALGHGADWLMRHAVPADLPEEIYAQLLPYYKNWYNEHSMIKTDPFAGINPLLQELQTNRIHTGIVSNKPNPTVQVLSERFFHGVPSIGEGPGVRTKPNPDAVLHMLDSFGVHRRNAVYVGDTEVDLETARNAGMDCILVSWGFRTPEQLKQAGAPVILDTMEQLRARLLG